MTEGRRGLAPAGSELLLRVWADPHSVGDARRAVKNFCRDGGLTVLADDAELLTSELMTNACRVTHGLITLVAMRDEGGVVVSVTDDDRTEVAMSAGLPAADADAGRGLFLVDQVAGGWGTTHYTGGKTVWFRLP
jgi:anti-sigma regulatory factor (Ser/Thr protein kinase)